MKSSKKAIPLKQMLMRPLLLFLIYVRLLKEAVFEGRKSTVRTAVCILLNLAVPLYMENAAAMIFGANVLVLLYVLHYDRQKARTMLMYTLVSTIGVCLIRFSPGALARSSRDHAAFAALTLFEKIAVNLPSLMTYTFTAYPWFYGILSVILVLWAQKQKTTVRIPVMVLSVLSLAEIVLPVPEVFSWVFRMIFLCMMFAVSLCLQERGERFFALFILLCGCGANAVMLVSPIFAVRSSVYTIFLFMLWGLYLLERTELPEAASRFLSVVSCAAAMVLVLRYTQLYRMINRINLKRMSQIQYYADRPDITDLWIMGYPENSVHSADVVEGDDFHDAVFKEYYFLNPESTLHFYYLKEYDAESILNG